MQITLSSMSRIGEVMGLLYDPFQKHQAIEKLVTRAGSEGQEKKYYRFRPARWYGGIVTADCVGCGLMCRFCWVSDEVMLHPAGIGRFYTPGQVADGLIKLARKHGMNQLRISGGEPTIGKAHLLQVLDLVRGEGFSFILETNGMPVACDEGYARDLSKYEFVHARVSLKGCSEKEFAMLTGAKPEAFVLQLKSLQNLIETGVSCHASVMVSFSTKKSLQMLIQRLRQISPKLAEEVEVEELILYPHVVSRIKKYGLRYRSGHNPSKVPKEQV
jgi:uncharacterized Fe-S cluster-containing radical SAM superfamily protein